MPNRAPIPTPVTSEIPTLLLSGAYDTRTPPTYAMSQQQHMPNAHHLIIRDQSHGVSMTSECANKAMAVFIAAPAASGTPVCAGKQERPQFITEFPEPARAEPINRR